MSTHRQINQRGNELIKHFESLFLKAYKDPVGIWTIGWGHTGLSHREGTVYAGRQITEDEAQYLFEHDMLHFEEGVHHLVKVTINDDQFSALGPSISTLADLASPRC